MVYGSAKIQVKVFLIVMEVKLILSILDLALWRFLENFARETEVSVTVASLFSEKVRDTSPPPKKKKKKLQELAGEWSFCNISRVGHVPRVRGCVSLILAGKFVESVFYRPTAEPVFFRAMASAVVKSLEILIILIWISNPLASISRNPSFIGESHLHARPQSMEKDGVSELKLTLLP
ncbi:hypothetical protein NC652_018496 [Populus alba x Populus x berolinensis]|nr:hypothetical protein NC652_018496 [Populus alba x Populus x berolinensis]